jgi:hypothetical protein
MILILPIIQATAQSQPYLPLGEQQVTPSLGVFGIPVIPDIAIVLSADHFSLFS